MTRSRDWQARRNRFNHDWLKNKFLLSLERLVSTAEGEIQDEEYVERFISGGIRDWREGEEPARKLIDSVEMAMSPSVYLESEPLCQSSHRDWLRQVVHVSWRSRVGVGDLVATSRESLFAASQAYNNLCYCLENHSDKEVPLPLVCCREQLIEFQRCCQKLATVFENFPYRVFYTDQ